jgi:hypothetical protein
MNSTHQMFTDHDISFKPEVHRDETPQNNLKLSGIFDEDISKHK